MTRLLGSILGTGFALSIALAAHAAGLPEAKAGNDVSIYHVWQTPLEFDGTYLLVPVRLGSLQSSFVLDTAAGGIVVSPAVQTSLGITKTSDADVVGAGGNASYKSIELPSFSVARQERKGWGATVIDLARFKKNKGEPYGGILGNNFLSEYDVEIDMPEGRMRLHSPMAPGSAPLGFEAAAAVVNKAESKGFIIMEVLVEGRPVTAILDTGASRSVVNWNAARQAGVTLQSAGLRRGEKPIGGLGAKAAETHFYRFNDIKAGQTAFSPDEVRVADLEIFKVLGLGGKKPAMLFGLDMLKDRSLFVSYSTNRVYFAPAKRLASR